MTESRKDYLDREFLLSFENDSEIYHKVRELVADNKFGHLYHDVGVWVGKLRAHFKLKALTMTDVGYLAIELWHGADGSPMSSTTYGAARRAHQEISTTTETSPDLGTTSESTEMTINAKAPFTTANYVFGRDVSTMSSADLIDAIRRVEGEIKSLKSVETKSAFIDKEIKNLEDGLAKIVAALDAMAA